MSAAITKGSTIQHNGANYRVWKVDTVEDHRAIGNPSVADLMESRGQHAYLCARRGNGHKVHLFRLNVDGTTHYEQAI